MKFHKLFMATAVASSLALGGCLGDLGLEEDDSSSDSGPSGSLSGKAADGYLQSANVCLDLNANKVCDRGEPSATTGPNGDFTINAEQSQIDSANIVVEIIAGTTVDQDNPGTPIEKAYSLTAPAGYSFVSPITTLVQAKVEELGSVEEAEAALQASIGTSIDFDEDYIAGQSDDLASDDAQAAFKALHQVAQVVAAVMAENLGGNNIDQGSGNFEDVMDLVIGKVELVLDIIVNKVESSGDDFDPSAIAEDDNIANATEVDPTTLEGELELQDDLEDAVKADFQALLAANAGLHWLEYYFDFESNETEIGYGVTTFDGNTTTNTFFAWNGTGFAQEADDGEEGGDNGGHQDPMNCGSEGNEPCYEEPKELVLGANGWAQPVEGENNNDGPEFTGYGADGSVLMSDGTFTFKLEGEEFSLTGNKIKDSLFGTGNWEWAESVNSTSNFGDGAKGYKIKMSTSEDVYLLPDYEEECEEETGVDMIPGDCNLAEFFEAGASEPDYKSSSFNPIVTTRGTGADPSNYTAFVLGGGDSDPASGVGFALMAEFGPENTIFYYEVELQNDQVTALTKVLEAPYEQRTVHGETLIVFKVPFQLVPDFFDGDHHDDQMGGDGGTQNPPPSDDSQNPQSGDDIMDENDRGPRPDSIFLTEHDGYWRFGALLNAGTPVPDDAPFVYNKAAMDSIKAAFDAPYEPISHPQP